MWAVRIWLVRGKAREDGSGVVGRARLYMVFCPCGDCGLEVLKQY